MRKAFAAVALCCALALSVCVGCQSQGASSAGTALDPASFVGVWELDSVEAEHEGVAMDADEVDVFLRGMETVAELSLEEGGRAELNLFDNVMVGEWVQVNSQGARLTITTYEAALNDELANGNILSKDDEVDGAAVTIEDGMLVVSLDDVAYVFAPVE